MENLRIKRSLLFDLSICHIHIYQYEPLFISLYQSLLDIVLVSTATYRSKNIHITTLQHLGYRSTKNDKINVIDG